MLYGVCKGGYSQRGLGGCQKGSWAQVQFLVSGAKLKYSQRGTRITHRGILGVCIEGYSEYSLRGNVRVLTKGTLGGTRAQVKFLVSGAKLKLMEPNGQPFQSMVREYSWVPLACS